MLKITLEVPEELADQLAAGDPTNLLKMVSESRSDRMDLLSFNVYRPTRV